MGFWFLGCSVSHSRANITEIVKDTSYHQLMQQGLHEFCPSYETVRRLVDVIREGKEGLNDEG